MSRYIIKPTGAFKRDLKRLKKQGKSLAALEVVVDTLAQGKALDRKYRAKHSTGNTSTMRSPEIGKASVTATSSRTGC